jgi:hypothetical protein
VSARVCAVAVILVLALSLPNAFAQLEGGEHHPSDVFNVNIACENNSDHTATLQAKVEDPGGLVVRAVIGEQGPKAIFPGREGGWTFYVEIPKDAAPGPFPGPSW